MASRWIMLLFLYFCSFMEIRICWRITIFGAGIDILIISSGYLTLSKSQKATFAIERVIFDSLIIQTSEDQLFLQTLFIDNSTL